MSTQQKASSLFKDSDQTLFLVDISSFIFRAFFAIRALNNSKGEPTNAVYGVATMLEKLVDEARPNHLAVVCDSKGPTFRHEVYEDYKANRGEPPEDLIPQFERIDQFVKSFHFPTFRVSGMEADDIIATLTQKWIGKSKQKKVVIVTGDKDLMQLVSDQVFVWDTMKNKVFGPDEVVEKFSVLPSQMRDYLALVGDASDNIPGVPSIGPKTAASLLKEFKDLKQVLKAAKDNKISGKKGVVLNENEDQALLSSDLVTLKSDVPLDYNPNQVHFNFELGTEGESFLKELEFHTLLERWRKKYLNQDEKSPVIEAGNIDNDQFRSVADQKSFEKVLTAIEKKKEFGFDLETTSLNPREAKIVGVSVCYDSKFGCYIPIGHDSESNKQLNSEMVLSKLKPFLENPKYKKIGQNLKYDWSVLYQYGIAPDGIGADTMVASYVLDPSSKHNLDFLCSRYLDYQTLQYKDVCGSGKDQISFSQVEIPLATRYAAEDSLCAVRLWDVLKKKLKQESLMEVFARVDLPLVPVLAKMEHEGVLVDLKWLGKLSKDFEKELKELEDRIYAYTQGPVNLNSPKQLSKLLFEDLKLPVQSKTKTGYSTDAKVLDALSPLHEVPRLLVDYREIAKLKSTYVEPLPKLVDPATGRIHANFHQTVTATGRLSSSHPNLQNIPVRTARGKKIRRAFIPSSGNVLLSADYSQIELRLLAHMSEDPSLVEAFQNGEDVHRQTAAEIFHTSPDQVKDSQRSVAKAINFGLMYGKTAFGLSQELKISRTEAKLMIEKYFKKYSRVKEFLDQQVEDAKERGWVMTLSGRKRALPEIHSRNPAIRNNAERMAMNTPLQGTAADLMKIAMVELNQALKTRGFQSKMLIQVHDEVLLDCPKDELKEVQQCVEQELEGAMKLSVPLVVNSESGKNWMEL